MKVSDILNIIRQNADYFPNSLYLKASTNDGCVYKWLAKGSPLAIRREIFIAIDSNDTEEILENKIALDYIEVYPAG